MATPVNTYRGVRRMGSGHPIPMLGLPTDQPDIDAVLRHLAHPSAACLYDTFRCPAGVPMPNRPTYMFTAALGTSYSAPYDRSVILEKTLADTNMRSGAMLNPPQDFVMKRLRIVLSPCALPRDRDMLLRGGAYAFHLLNYIEFEGPVVECTVIERIEKEHFGDDAKPLTIAGTFAKDLGPYALYIPALVHFTAVLQFDPFIPESDIEFRVMLEGVMGRGQS